MTLPSVTDPLSNVYGTGKRSDNANIPGSSLFTVDPASGVATEVGATNPVPVSLPTGFATAANQATANTALATIAAGTPALGQAAASASVPVVLPADQDPIWDTSANGTKTSVTTSATIITPATGMKFIRVITDVAIFVNVAGNTAVDDGSGALVLANQEQIIPVKAGVAVKALSSSGTATVRCTPLIVRT